MSSWKQYGGRTHLDSQNYLYSSAITCQDLTILNAYNGSLVINGTMTINGNASISGNIDISGNISVTNLNILRDITVYGNLEVADTLIIDNQIRFGQDSFLQVMQNGDLIWDLSAHSLILYGTNPNILTIGTDLSDCTTILAQNNTGNRIEAGIRSNDLYIGFVNETSTASIHCDMSNLIIESSGSVNVPGNMVIGPPGADQTSLQEEMLLIDTGSISYLPGVYETDISQGQALTAIHSSSMGLTAVSLMDGSGVSYGMNLVGGSFPNDSSRSFGQIVAGYQGPGITLVSGNTLINPCTIGFNTYSPITDEYTLDINGPVRIHHGEIVETFISEFAITNTSFNGSQFFSIGSKYSSQDLHHYVIILDSSMNYLSYQQIETSLGGPTIPFNAIYAMPTTSLVFVGGPGGYLYYSNNNGLNWYSIFNLEVSSFLSLYSILLNPSTIRIFATYSETVSNPSNPSTTVFDISKSLLMSGGNIFNNQYSYIDYFDTSVDHFLQVSGYGSYIYTIGSTSGNISNTLFKIYDRQFNVINSIPISYSLKHLQVFDSGIVLLGGNQYYYSVSHNPSSFTGNIIPISSVKLNSCSWYNSSFAVLVGTNLYDSTGVFFYSNDGLSTFQSVPDSILNQQGNSVQLLRSELSNIWMNQLDTFLIIGKHETTNHYLSVYSPDIFFPSDNPVLDIYGKTNFYGNNDISGNLTVIDISSNNIAFNSLQGNNIDISYATINAVDVSYAAIYSSDLSNANIDNLYVNNSAIFDTLVDISFIQIQNESALYGNVAIGHNEAIGDQLAVGSLHNFGPLQQIGPSYFLNDTRIIGNTFIKGSLNTASAQILNTLYINGQLVPPISFNENSGSLSLGLQAGISQSHNSISIGYQAGQQIQQGNTIAIGTQAGNYLQGDLSIAIGGLAGFTNQDTGSIAIGNNSGQVSQSYSSMAIGTYSGNNNQGPGSMAIGSNSGQINQGAASIAIGPYCGNQNQGSNSLAFGSYAGENNQGSFNMAIGTYAAQNNQQPYCIAIGSNAGQNNQQSNSIAIGNYSGQQNQQTSSIAFGVGCGRFNQSSVAIAIGSQAAESSQSFQAIAIGNSSGRFNQGEHSVAIGSTSGFNNQGSFSVAVGESTGRFGQGQACVSIGAYSGYNGQGNSSVAIGNRAGNNGQGTYSIAIGTNSAPNNQHSYSICLNAAGGDLDATHSGLFIKPLRRMTTIESGSYPIYYNPSSGEFIYYQP